MRKSKKESIGSKAGRLFKKLTKWFYDIHNKVNSKLRKQGQDKERVSFSEVCKHYESFRATCSSIKNTCK